MQAAAAVAERPVSPRLWPGCARSPRCPVPGPGRACSSHGSRGTAPVQSVPAWRAGDCLIYRYFDLDLTLYKLEESNLNIETTYLKRSIINN